MINGKGIRRGTLFLAELLLALMIFMLAASVCVKLIAWSRGAARESITLSRAVCVAENAAECIEAGGGDIKTAAALLGAEYGEGRFFCEPYEGLFLDASLTETDRYLKSFTIAVRDGDGTIIYGLNITVFCGGD